MTHGEKRPPDAAASAAKSMRSAMLEDWISIWESELAALAADREGQELWRSMVSQWAEQARAAAAWIDAVDFIPGRPSGSGAQEGTAPAAAAPDPRGDAIAQLARRVEELERRVLEHAGAATVDATADAGTLSS